MITKFLRKSSKITTNNKRFQCYSLASYKQHLENSLNNPEKFWSDQANQRLKFIENFSKVSESNFNTAEFKWFLNGKINAKENCIDRHVLNNPNKTALIFEDDEPGNEKFYSYRDLQKLTQNIAYKLKNLGVQKHDKVAIYMPTNAESVAAMLACAQIGAVHNVVFAGFSSKALSERINDSKAKVLVTSKIMRRGGKDIDIFEKIVKDAVGNSDDCLTHVLMQGSEKDMSDVAVSYKNSLFKNNVKFEHLNDQSSKDDELTKNEVLDSEDELFILYTSGSTGKPKGLVHTQAGYLLYAGLTHQQIFQYNENDIYACVADIGWITGHTYVVYGPLMNGATTVLFGSTPTYPDAGRYWEMCERLKINQFYTSPTAIRLLYGQGDEFVNEYDLSKLKVLGTVGEPIGEEPWKWYHSVVGKNNCPIADTYWQSETGGIAITPNPILTEDGLQTPGYAGHGFLGQKPFVDPSNNYLYLQQPWPGMARTILNDHNRFISTYYPNPELGYMTGDLAEYDAEKGFLIKGRADDVINISGKRLGTAEIESVINQHPLISESAVISIPDEVKGEVPIAFVTRIGSEGSGGEGQDLGVWGVIEYRGH